jgi:signal transduction histidine kinase
VPDALLLVLACVVSAGCGALASLRLGVPLACSLAAVLAVAGAEFVPLLLVTLAPWAAGRLLRSRRELVQALEERNRALEAEQAALAELAVRQERARIARELHDIVAHHLAVIVIQAGAGRLDASNGALRFEGIGAAGREALGELDRLVELLQAEHPADLGALVGQARAAGVPLEYSPAEVPAALRDVAYRVVQEALTNAMKHAAGSAVSVRLAVGDGALEVEVRDAGAAASPTELAASGAGVGLAGMRERVEAVGGRLEAGPWNRGWRVLARLPTPAG